MFRLADGARHLQLEIPGLEGATLTSAQRSLSGDLALGTSDGRAGLAQMRFRPVFENQVLKDLDVALRVKRVLQVDAAKRPLREVASQVSADGELQLAALVGDDELVLARVADAAEGEPVPEPSLATLRTRDAERISHVLLGRGALVATTEAGQLYYWELADATPRLTGVTKVSDVPLTAVEFGLGGNSVIVGDQQGRLSGWFRARPSPDADLVLVKAHDFESQHTPILSIGSSTRERSFVTGGQDGSVVVRHLTSERTLLRFAGAGGPAETVLVTPRADGMLVRSGSSLDRYSLENPHPEFSWRALFGKVWYEGYPRPEYVWQSTGATDDFEPKLSLVPLVFGTIKATFYALVFAIPIAVFGSALHLAVRAPEDQGARQADGRDHGRAAERRDRLHRRPVARLARRGRAGTGDPDARVPAAVRHVGRAALGPPAPGSAQAPAARHRGGADPAPAAARRLRLGPVSVPGSRPSSSAETPRPGSPRRWGSSTTSATASWSGSRWASR